VGRVATQVEWGGAFQVRLHLHFTAEAAAAAAAEAQKLKKQAVWVRMHLQGRRGRERVVLSLRATPFPLRKKSPNSQISKISRVGPNRIWDFRLRIYTPYKPYINVFSV
jgi:hypothetical protein